MLTRSLDLRRYLDQGKSLFLFGPRGVGKSRLLAGLTPQLDHSFLIDLLKSEIYSHYRSAPQFLRHDIERRLEALPPNEPLTVRQHLSHNHRQSVVEISTPSAQLHVGQPKQPN